MWYFRLGNNASGLLSGTRDSLKRSSLLQAWWQIITAHNHNRSQLPFTVTITVTLSGAVSQVSMALDILSLGSCGHTHTHTLTDILYVCEFCQCHLISLLQGQRWLQHLWGAHSQPIMTNQSFHWRPQGDCYSSNQRGGDSLTHSQVTASLSFCRDGLFHYSLWFTFKSSQKTDFNLTRFHLYSFRLAAHIRPLMFWCLCFYLQHIPSVPG